MNALKLNEKFGLHCLDGKKRSLPFLMFSIERTILRVGFPEAEEVA